MHAQVHLHCTSRLLNKCSPAPYLLAASEVLAATHKMKSGSRACPHQQDQSM